MKMNFFGYVREDGSVGSRNYVAVIPSVFCVNEVAANIVRQTDQTRAIMHHQGCCQLSPDLNQVTEALIALGKNPNVGAALIVSLGCEGADYNRIYRELAATGKPVEHVVLQDVGGTSRCIQIGTDLAQKMIQKISPLRREEAPLAKFTMGIKCGSSDTTSGLSANPVIGYVADRVVEEGGTVIFGETTEFIGGEHLLQKRAATPEVAARIKFIVDRMETKAKSMGVDMRTGQPTPGNIKGGLSTIEEKTLGAIVKSGTKSIRGVLEYTEIPDQPGLWIKDCPGRENEVLTAMAIGGAQTILFSTGRGAPQGFPIVPVLKICGNPLTFEKLQYDMDINAGKVITGEKSIEEVGELALQNLLSVLSGMATKSESIHYSTTMDINVNGPAI